MGNPNWVKGVSGNPRGRTPGLGLSPELRSTIEKNKAAMKSLLLHYFNMNEDEIAARQRQKGIPFLEKIIAQCFERTANDGNVDGFRKLLEIVFGKIPEEPREFELTEDERELILAYRERCANALNPGGEPDSGKNQD